MGLIAALKSTEGTHIVENYSKNTTMQLLFLTLLMVVSANSYATPDLNRFRSPSDESESRSARAVHGHGHDHGHDFDPHSKDMHCHDVSVYGPVEWPETDCEKCTVSFPKRQVPKRDRVCIDIPSVKCDVKSYTECTMENAPIKYNVTTMKDEYYDEIKCYPEERIIQHKKQVPECKNVTKHNCVTKWEVLPSGEKVWSGNDDCTEVTWKECSLVDVYVDFNITEMVCKNTTEIPYMTCKEKEEETMTMKSTCVAKAAVECFPTTETLCTTVEWTEFYQEVDRDCTPVKIRKPEQTVSHRKKCLLTSPDADLDPVVLQDLEPNEKYNGPIQQLGPFDENDKSSKGDVASAFSKAVNRLLQDAPEGLDLGDSN